LSRVNQILINYVKNIPLRDVLDYYDIQVPKNNMIRCINPEHNDSTPSMHIYDDTNSCHCFGKCRKSYDTIEIVRMFEKSNFEDAIMFLYGRFKVKNFIEKQVKNNLSLYKQLNFDFRKIMRMVQMNEEKKNKVLNIFQTIDMYADNNLLLLKFYKQLIKISGVA
jgi:DNA primase